MFFLLSTFLLLGPFMLPGNLSMASISTSTSIFCDNKTIFLELVRVVRSVGLDDSTRQCGDLLMYAHASTLSYKVHVRLLLQARAQNYYAEHLCVNLYATRHTCE